MRSRLHSDASSASWIGPARRAKTTAYAIAAVVMLACAGFSPALAQQRDHTPLNFGMNTDEASQALGVPLNYVRGRPGNELFVALPNVKGSALASRSDGLYLQFRRGRLAGWKGDWGTIRP
jgi:hypothetical protein